MLSCGLSRDQHSRPAGSHGGSEPEKQDCGQPVGVGVGGSAGNSSAEAMTRLRCGCGVSDSLEPVGVHRKWRRPFQNTRAEA